MDTQDFSASVPTKPARSNIDEYSENPNYEVQGQLKPLDGIGVSSGTNVVTAGDLARSTSRTSTSLILTSALASACAAAFLQYTGRKGDAHFVGQWVPSILLFGIYTKLIETQRQQDNEL